MNGAAKGPKTADLLLTVAEIAATLRINQETIPNWIDAGTLPAIRIGRRVRIRRADFNAFVSAHPAGPGGRCHHPGRIHGGGLLEERRAYAGVARGLTRAA